MTGLFQRAPAPILAPAPGVPWASGALFNPGAALDGGPRRLLADVLDRLRDERR